MHAKTLSKSNKTVTAYLGLGPSDSALGDATALETAIDAFGNIFGDFRSEGVDIGTIN